MSGSITATQVAAAYQAILRVPPAGGSTGAFATSVAAQINQGLLTLGNFESSLISNEPTTYSTLAALVTIDAFYNASPSSATLTTVATATSGTSFPTAAELHNLGYSDVNVWTILGAGWGADPTSNFFSLYNGEATGNTNDYTTFINAVYLREFGSLPTPANLQNILNDIPGVTQLLSGGGHTATPIQIMGGLYGFLLYTGQVNSIGAYATKAPAFLALAATDEATTPGSSSGLYGPEILGNPLLGTGPTATNQFLTTGNDNVTGTAIFGSLTPFNVNGIGPTLNAADVISGSPGTTNNTLTISDDFAAGNDQIPLGTTINNIQNVVLQTAGNAGGTGIFDTTAYPSVNNVTVNTSGNIAADNVRVSSGTVLTVNHLDANGGTVNTLGGSNVTVTNNAVAGFATAVNIGNAGIANSEPTGAIVVNSVGAIVTVLGGTTVNVNQSSIGGSVTVGTFGFSVSPAEPTGAVTVNAPATSPIVAGTPIAVYGGASASLVSGGGVVTIGAQVGLSSFTVSGNQTVVDNAAVALTSNYVTGANLVVVPVAAPSLPNGFTVGAPFAEIAVTTLGGAAVNITTNAGGVTVGPTAAAAYNGTVLIPGLVPSGNVTINDTSDLSPHISTIPTNGGGGTPANTPVSVFGGANISVTDSGSPITVGNVNGTNVVAPTGTVTTTDTAQLAHDGIVNKDDNVTTVIGGTTATVTTNAGDVAIGTAAGTPLTNPTGDIMVTDTGTDSVTSFGGANVTVAATNGAVQIGNATATTNPTGNVVVAETGLFTGDTGIVNSSVTVNGGVNGTVTTTGGNVTVGNKSTPMTGPVVVTDTQGGPSSDVINVVGGAAATGASVTIAETASSGAVTVGIAGAAALNAAGTALAKPSDYANGTVSVTNESPAGTNPAGATNVFGTGAVSVNTNGAMAVTIVGGGSATVVDEQTTPATGGATAGSPIGTSTLTTVSLDGIGAGASTLTSGVLANVTVLDSAKSSPTNVAIVSPAALTLTLGNDAVGTAVTDAKTTAITIASSGTASDTFSLNAPLATALTFTNTAAVTLAAAAGSSDIALKTITISGSGAVTLPDFSGVVSPTTQDSNLTSITAAGSSGAVTLNGIDPRVTSFTGGTGPDSVTIVNNSNLQPGGTVNKIAGGSGSNTIVADYAAAATDTALHQVNGISGFQTLGLGTLANSFNGPFAAKGFTAFNPYDAGGFGSLVVGATAGSVVFSNVGAGTENLAITASQGGANTISYLLNDPVSEVDPLAITLASDTTTLTTAITTVLNLGTDTVTSSKASIGAVGNISIASLGPSTLVGTNQITINDTIAGLSGLPNGGTVSISVSGDHAATVIYDLPGGAGNPTASSVTGITVTDSAKVDVTHVALSAGGATITGGAGQLVAFGSSELGGSDNTKAVDTFVSGSGGGVFTLGAGGGWNTALASKTAPDGSNDSGNETVNLSASTGVTDTLNVGPAVVSINNGAGVGGITGFQAVANPKTADVIALTGTGAVGNGAKGTAATSGYSVMSNAAANNSSPAGVQNVFNFVTQSGGQIGKDMAALDPNSLLQNLTFSSSNGVITFGAVDGSNINQFNPTQLLTAAEGIVSEEAWLTQQDQVAVFTAAFAGLAANTYIVASDLYNQSVTVGSPLIANVFHIFGATEIELNGVTSGITGFGATAAGNVVELSGANQTLPGPAGATQFLTLANGGVGNQGTVAGKVYNDTGFSEDTLALAGPSSTNTYNNLGSFAQIDVTAAGAQGNLVIGAQVGTQGSDSFQLNFSTSGGASTLNSLTVNSDDLVTILLTPGSTDTITTFTDATNTVASLVASGTGNLVITNAISDATLTSIDAHAVTGFLTLNVTETVNINGALGGDTLLASGAGDVISIGSATNAFTGSASITANAAGDTITLTHEAGASNNFVAAASGGDTITVDSGTNSLGGTYSVSPPGEGSLFATALGTGDTINLHSGATFAGAATDLVWAGSGTTVNLGISTAAWGAGGVADTATVAVMGDVTGATSGNSPAMTVITGFSATNANGNLYLQFDGSQVGHTVPLTAAVITSLTTSAPTFTFAGGSATNALVNEASATSLANALDIAASQTVQIDALAGAGHTGVTNGVAQLNAHTALTDWFQFGGNTYIVEALNTTSAAAAHTALAATDVVVELTGLVNVATAIGGGHLHFV